MNIYNPDRIADAICLAVTNKKAPTEKQVLYRVISGSFKNKDNALKVQNELKAKGYDSFIEVKEV